MQYSGHHTDRVQLHLGEDAGHFKGMRQVRLAGQPGLTIVYSGRIDVGTLDNIQIRIRVVITNLVDDVVNADQFWLLVTGFWLLVPCCWPHFGMSNSSFCCISDETSPLKYGRF